MEENFSQRLNKFVDTINQQKRDLGLTKQQIADAIGVSLSTFHRHCKNGFRSLTVEHLDKMDLFFTDITEQD